MTALLLLFLLLAALLWISVFGYWLLLRWLAGRRRRISPPLEVQPAIAVIVPVLNEEQYVEAKLADLARTAYPPGRMTVIVVDGGSRDRTAALVQEAIDRGTPARLLRVPKDAGKMAQIACALDTVNHEIAVITDADARLDPACIGELVRILVHDSETALVGAMVQPASDLLEERLYWWVLNRLWWLEGEALSAAVVSGVCYAVRRAESPASPDAPVSPAEDVLLALAAGARGFRVRLCPTAHATEMRVPQTPRELIRFRRRRGAGYVLELRRATSLRKAPSGWRLALRMRLWHFLVTPKIAIATVIAGAFLLPSPHWPWPFAVLTAFAVPAIVALARSRPADTRRAWWRVGFAASRLLGLTWVALLTLPAIQSVSGDA